MRILHLFLWADFGGVETYARDLFAGLEDRGHENLVIYGGSPLELGRPGRRVTYWPDARAFLHRPGPLIEALQGLIAEDQPDVAFVHAVIHPDLARAILAALPTVYFAHTYNAFCPSGARLFQRNDAVCQLRGVPDARCLVNAYRRRCNTGRPGRLWDSYRRSAATLPWVRAVDAVVCDSGYVANRHIENGVPSDRIHVLPSPVSVPPAESVHWPRNGRRILFVGRLAPEKGLDYLIEAMARIPAPSTLTVAGSGRERARLEALVHRRGLTERVQFLGRVDRPALAKIYAVTSVAVVPSVWPEPFGMVGPEAMAYGVPVVAFRVGGIPEWLEHGTAGFLVEPKDIGGLVERTLQLLENPSLAQRLGARGRELAIERFTIAPHLDGLLEVFQGAIASRRREGEEAAVVGGVAS